MQNLAHRSPSLTRRELEEAWRARSETARERYEMASRRYREFLKEKPQAMISRNDALLAFARAKSESLEEYTRVLKIFTQLTVEGRVPEEQFGANSTGEPS